MALLTSSEEVHKRALQITKDVKSVTNVICFDAPPSEPASYARHVELGQDERIDSIRPRDTETAGLIYTSGDDG